jgi:hypothetical protein
VAVHRASGRTPVLPDGDDPVAQRLILLGLEKFFERPQAAAFELLGVSVDAATSETVVRAMAAREAA